MYTRAIVKSLILPSISVGVVRAEGKEDESDTSKKLVRPRDLALYVDPPKCVTCSTTAESDDGFLLTTIRCARQELQSVLEQARIIQSEASSMLENVRKETSDAVSYLQQDENLLPRMGAIGFGAFAGYILAVRKGILKKMLYSAAGASAIAAVAYPNEAREYSEEVLCELKKYAVIGYHFVNGADVDWKKLNEKMRCLEKSRIIEGRWPEAVPEQNDPNSSSKLVQAHTSDNASDPSKASNMEETVSTSVKPEKDKLVQAHTSDNASDSSKASNTEENESTSLEPEKDKSDTFNCNTHTPCPQEEPLPQDRPKAPDTLRRYKSYSDECKLKSGRCKRKSSGGACGGRVKGCQSELATSDSGKLGGVCCKGKPAMSNEYPGEQEERRSPNSEGIAETGQASMSKSPCASGSDNRPIEEQWPDINRSQISPRSGRQSSCTSADSLPNGQFGPVPRQRTNGRRQQRSFDNSESQDSQQCARRDSAELPSSSQTQPRPRTPCQWTQHPACPPSVDSSGAPKVQKGLPIDSQIGAELPPPICPTSFVQRNSPQSQPPPYREALPSPASGHAPPDRQLLGSSSAGSAARTCARQRAQSQPLQRNTVISEPPGESANQPIAGKHTICMKRSKPKPVSEGV